QDYTMNCFGGAGGQHACLVAERLGINTIFLHPLSGVLSAYGMGLADIKTERQAVLELELKSSRLALLLKTIDELTGANAKDLAEQGLRPEQLKHKATALLRYKGTDTNIQIPVAAADEMQQAFEASHQRQFGFIAPEKMIILEIITVESFGGSDEHQEKRFAAVVDEQAKVEAQRQIYSKGKWLPAPVYKIESLQFGHVIQGPAIIIEPTGTIIIEQHWEARLNQYKHIILHNKKSLVLAKVSSQECAPITVDPITLEIFNKLFMSIAEQMGIVLQNTSQSVNVKERLDFSCAVFDRHGNLVANAPHVPVHLGSMDSSVKVIINGEQSIHPGDVFVQNNPYKGGSHLPDITVISPVFSEDQSQVIFYLASRAHHEDVGGVAPGSMSPLGTTIEEEGIVFDGEKLVEKGVFQSERIRRIFSSGPYPARNIEQNIADLMAQTAANAVGATELKKLVSHYGLPTVYAYMGFIQDSAEESVRKVIDGLQDGVFSYELDSAAVINLQIKINHSKRSAKIDFTGTSEQQQSNFNAPGAITQAAVLYVFRCLVNDDIPLNAGCMTPLEIIVPTGSMLNPNYPAAVVAGNVETSQAVTNALFAALGKLGSSQGTMNNLTFGNQRYQYYETICSGSPAGPGFNGVAAVHTHMTNTRMTDPEIMEQRYPVLLEEFSIDRHSGGLGQWNAGDGITRRIRFLEDMQCSILSGHRRLPPYGLKGGKPGRIGQNWLTRSDGSIEDLGGCGHRGVHPGDTISIVSPTGGGFGVVVDKIAK
ncbi:MAG: 5-oxoprolinase (ATP-hydrolyzing), partial [Paraglaciecola sp.]